MIKSISNMDLHHPLYASQFAWNQSKEVYDALCSDINHIIQDSKDAVSNAWNNPKKFATRTFNKVTQSVSYVFQRCRAKVFAGFYYGISTIKHSPNKIYSLVEQGVISSINSVLLTISKVINVAGRALLVSAVFILSGGFILKEGVKFTFNNPIDGLREFISKAKTFTYSTIDVTTAIVKAIGRKVRSLSSHILFGALLCACYYTNPTLSSLGFVFSILFDRESQDLIDKISKIFENWSKLGLVMTCVAAFLSLPVTWATGSVLSFVYLGSTVSREAYPFESRITNHQRPLDAPQDLRGEIDETPVADAT